MNRFVAGTLKLELHLHIERDAQPNGCCYPGQKRNGVVLPYPDVAAFAGGLSVHGSAILPRPLLSRGGRVAKESGDFYDLTWAYLGHCHQDKVLHTEIFFDPQTHTERGISLGNRYSRYFRLL